MNLFFQIILGVCVLITLTPTPLNLNYFKSTVTKMSKHLKENLFFYLQTILHNRKILIMFFLLYKITVIDFFLFIFALVVLLLILITLNKIDNYAVILIIGPIVSGFLISMSPEFSLFCFYFLVLIQTLFFF